MVQGLAVVRHAPALPEGDGGGPARLGPAEAEQGLGAAGGEEAVAPELARQVGVGKLGVGVGVVLVEPALDLARVRGIGPGQGLVEQRA